MKKLRGWIRFLLVGSIIGSAIIVAGYRLGQPEPETVVAEAPKVRTAPLVERSISQQALNVVESTDVDNGTEMTSFVNGQFGYQIHYFENWQQNEVAPNQVALASPDGKSVLTVEAVGPLTDGLSAWVDRSLGEDMILTRQLLTVQGLEAERLIVLSEATGEQQTKFFIASEDSAFLLVGTGEQKSIELIARSFQNSEFLALR